MQITDTHKMRQTNYPRFDNNASIYLRLSTIHCQQVAKTFPANYHHKTSIKYWYAKLSLKKRTTTFCRWNQFPSRIKHREIIISSIESPPIRREAEVQIERSKQEVY